MHRGCDTVGRDPIIEMRQDLDMADDTTRWYWCLTHGTVEEGQQCRAQDRLGPYPSAEAARNWKDTHGQRHEQWEEADEEWEKWPEKG